MAELACRECNLPAQHEAQAYSRWLPYCCQCFNHDWSQQRLIDGQQCGKVLVTRQGLPTHEWEWRKDQ